MFCGFRIIGSLGSGQFGVVSKGRWQAAVEGPVDVAIKTLRPSANETDRVKFLQEAAINGQFRHPNIVQLHGVVTVGEPVRRKGVRVVWHINDHHIFSPIYSHR